MIHFGAAGPTFSDADLQLALRSMPSVRVQTRGLDETRFPALPVAKRALGELGWVWTSFRDGVPVEGFNRRIGGSGRLMPDDAGWVFVGPHGWMEKALSKLFPDVGSRNGKKRKIAQPEPKTPVLIREILGSLGLEVGDYHHDEGMLVRRSGRVYQVRLEGWGEDCLADQADEVDDELAREEDEVDLDEAAWGARRVQKLRERAYAAAAEMARRWKVDGGDRFESHWAQTGWVKTDDDEVWAVTWGLKGPFRPVPRWVIDADLVDLG